MSSTRDRSVQVDRRRDRCDADRRKGLLVFLSDLVLAVAFARGVDDAAAFADSAASRSGRKYASCSQSVIGGSTSARCVILRMFANFVFDFRSARRTCGALSTRPRNTQTSRKLRFGRTKK